MANDLTQILAGACSLTLGGSVLGYTDGPVEVEVERGTRWIKVSQLPGVARVKMGTDQNIRVRGKLQQWDPNLLADIMPELTETGATVKAGWTPGYDISSSVLALTVHPILMSSDTTHDLHIYKAVATQESCTWEYGGDGERMVNFEFAAMPDTTKSDGNYLWDVGVTADAAAPTVSTITPNDNATDIAITTTVVIKFSETMAVKSLVNANSHTCIGLYNETDGDAVIACSSAMSTTTNTNDTITITPDASLENSKVYRVIIPEFPTDLNGNAFVAEEYKFTTIA